MTLPDLRLSQHFTLNELTFSETAARRGLDNTPGPAALANLKRVAMLLEEVRELLGRPILVNSGFRSPEVNAAVGSRPTSQHLTGCAADIRVPGMTPAEVVRAVVESRIAYDQVIREFDRWTHISVPSVPAQKPRRQALVIDAKGVRALA